MSRLNHEEQFNFLISCIRYSNNGRVDFEKVAEECDIVTKGAAAKRYERMMKAHSITVNTKGADESDIAPKKRRKRAVAADNGESDEEMSYKPSKKSKKAKAKNEEEDAGASADMSDNLDDAGFSVKAEADRDDEE